MPMGALPLALLLAASGLARIRAQGEVRWGGDLQGGEPYVFRDPRDPEKLVGFEVDLVRALAPFLGVRERFVPNDWSNLVPSLERGDFDLIVNGLEDTQALRRRILLSRPYFSFAEQLVVRRGSTLRTLDALRGDRMGTLASSLAHQILRGRPEIEIVLYGGQEEPYRDLQLGRTDAVLLGWTPARLLAPVFIGLFRGTPALVQLFILFYGIPPIVPLSAPAAAILGLGLNYGAYEAEVPRAALQAIPSGQAEAAASLGLSRAQALRLVLLPQALRTALPAMTNDLIALLKDTSLVSVITVVELTKQMTITAVDVRSWALPGALCGALYFAMSYPLARLAARLEARLEAAGEEPVVAQAA